MTRNTGEGHGTNKLHVTVTEASWHLKSETGSSGRALGLV